MLSLPSEYFLGGIQDYESGDSVVDHVAVDVLEYSSAVHVTSAELNSGLRMENLLTIALAKLADEIIAEAMKLIALANFTTTIGGTNVISAANFGFNDLQMLWGALQKSPIKNLVLDGAYLAKLLNVPSYFQTVGAGQGAWKGFGWDLIALNSNWTGASNKAIGFACNPQAIACIAGLPMSAGSPTLTQSTIVVPGIEIAVQQSGWFSVTSRTGWFSWGLMIGSARADATAGIVICSS